MGRERYGANGVRVHTADGDCYLVETDRTGLVTDLFVYRYRSFDEWPMEPCAIDWISDEEP